MQRQFKITVNGVNYQVAVEELGAAQETVALSTSFSAAPSVVSAPAPVPVVETTSQAIGSDELAQMGGVVAQIFVKVGATVSEGDRLMDLEAMKMKIPVISSHTGRVTRILVAEGDVVENGHPLISIA